MYKGLGDNESCNIETWYQKYRKLYYALKRKSPRSKKSKIRKGVAPQIINDARLAGCEKITKQYEWVASTGKSPTQYIAPIGAPVPPGYDTMREDNDPERAAATETPAYLAPVIYGTPHKTPPLIIPKQKDNMQLYAIIGVIGAVVVGVGITIIKKVKRRK